MTKRRYMPVMLLTVLMVGNSVKAGALGRSVKQFGRQLGSMGSTSSFVPSAPSSEFVPISRSLSTSSVLQDIPKEELNFSSNQFATLKKAHGAIQDVEEKGYKYYWNHFKDLASKNWLLKYLFGLGVVTGAGYVIKSQVGEAYGDEESVKNDTRFLKDRVQNLQLELSHGNTLTEAEVNSTSGWAKYIFEKLVMDEQNKREPNTLKSRRYDRYGKPHLLGLSEKDIKMIEENSDLREFKNQQLKYEVWARANQELFGLKRYVEKHPSEALCERWGWRGHCLMSYVSDIDKTNEWALREGFSDKVVPGVIVPEFVSELMCYMANSDPLRREIDGYFLKMADYADDEKTIAEALEKVKNAEQGTYTWTKANEYLISLQRRLKVRKATIKAWENAKHQVDIDRRTEGFDDYGDFYKKYGPLPTIKSSEES